MADFKKYQEQLVRVAKSTYKGDEVLSDNVLKAFYEVPRHLFVSRYRNYGCEDWLNVSDKNLEIHLGTIYADTPLCLKGTNEEFLAKEGSSQVSTISQPSFVLRLIDLLDLKQGHTVFELGTASGWNAALIAHMVGSKGYVFTAEIITDLATEAEKRIESFGLKNIKVISGEGGNGHLDGAPFDRVMFTAGAFDLPMAFHKQIREGGKLLFILKNKGGSDNLILLKKHRNYFQSIYSAPCGFVPMTGKYHIPDMASKYLSDLLIEKEIKENILQERPFFWGVGNQKYFLWGTSALRSFLSLFKNFEAIRVDGDEDTTFGWYEPETSSFCHATKGKIVSYGHQDASNKLIDKIKSWIEIGMPTLSNLQLKIFPSDATKNFGTWVSKRPQSTFIWSLPNSN